MRQPTPTPSTSSRTPKSKKISNPDADNDDLVLQGIQLAVDNLKETKNDEFNIFGQFVAAEIKRLPNDGQRQQLKRIIQRAIMNFAESVCILFLFHFIHSFSCGILHIFQIERQNSNNLQIGEFLVVDESGNPIIINSQNANQE